VAKSKKDKKPKKAQIEIDFNDLTKRLGGLVGFLVALGFSLWFLSIMWAGLTKSWPW
jgi:hypothetical protein